MGLFANAFTWWNGASWSVSLLTRFYGCKVGQDEYGNSYFHKKGDPAERWVVYSGSNDSSRVPPGWNAWLRSSIEEVPDEALPPRRHFELKPEPNLTGTIEAFRPDGSLSGNRSRPASTGDYQPWTPD
jgi:NADH:ubiquinone oxidoreductase subunit